MNEKEKMKIEDAKILENPGIEFKNKLNEISERIMTHEKRVIDEFTDRIILLIIRGAYNKVEKRIFTQNKSNTLTFIFKMNEQSFSKTLWDEIRDLWNKSTYETMILEEKLKNSINLKLKLPDVKIFEIELGYNELNISIYYEIIEKTKKQK